MVSHSEGRTLLTPTEIVVLRQLAKGPCEVARRTETFMKRPTIGEPFEVRTVEQRIVKRLMKAGLVRVDVTGHAHLTDEARARMAQD